MCTHPECQRDTKNGVVLPCRYPDPEYHEGRPVIREATGRKGVLVLCPVGHFYHFIPMHEWAGSMWEANLADPSFTVRCCGAMPQRQAMKDTVRHE